MKVPGLPKAIGTARKAALSVGADPGSTTVAKESRHA